MNNVTLIQSELDTPAPFRLMRLVEWAGFKITDFAQEMVLGTPPKARGVLVPLGQRATEVTLGKGDFLKNQRGYIWENNGNYIIPAPHPGFIQRGNARWSAAFINDLQKAVAVGRDGIPPQITDYCLDPSPLAAYRWAQDYRKALVLHPGLRLAFDIETPGKGDDEEGVELGDAPDRTWNIERIGFSYGPLSGLSIPWAPEYQAAIRLVLESDGDKVVWNAGFDVPRIRRAGVGIHGTIHDGMVAWHILHTDLPKRLGFVATFVCPYQPAWKHLSGSKPAFYNVCDADVEWRAFERIEQELRRAGLWEVYIRDVVELDPVLEHMTKVGMPVDHEVRLDRAIKLDTELKRVRAELEALMPMETRKIEHVYKNTPADTTGLLSRSGVRSVLRCPGCGLERPRKDHFKVFKKKVNPCAALSPRSEEVVVDEYYRLSEFSPSRDQLVRYHLHLKRALPTKYDKIKRGQKVSFDEENIKKLMLKYPDDPLYNLVLQYRETDKLLGTYVGRPVAETKASSMHVVGGIPVDADGRVRTTFGHNPSSLRLCSFNPNLQNIPRGSGLGKYVKDMFVAPKGSIFYERDFSGIEAVLVGYFAGAPNYIRLAKTDVHSFYTAYALHTLDPGRVSANDLPDLSWDQDRLAKRLKEIKKEFNAERNGLYKHLVHGANYLQTPKGARDHIFKNTNVAYEVKLIAQVMGVYFELFPEIRQWHRDLCNRVDGTKSRTAEDSSEVDPWTLGVCYARNPFGYVHHFYNVLDWERVENEWISTFGEDAKRLVSFLPQSTAAAIIKQAAKRIYNEFPWVGESLRLLIHDSIFGESEEEKVEECLKVSEQVMGAPIPELPLDPAWGMGEFLTINTEAKTGKSWGDMN